MNSCNNTIEVVAKINKITNDKASIIINNAEQENCVQCRNNGGCKSLSVKEYFFKNKSILIDKKDYKVNDELLIKIPKNILQHSVLYILGYPFIVFLLTVSVLLAMKTSELTAFVIAVVCLFSSYFLSKKLMQQRFIKNLIISKL